MSDAVNILTDEQRTLFRDVKHEFSVALALNEEKIRFADRALAMVGVFKGSSNGEIGYEF